MRHRAWLTATLKTVLAGGVDRSIRAWEIQGDGGSLVRVRRVGYQVATLTVPIAPGDTLADTTSRRRHP